MEREREREREWEREEYSENEVCKHMIQVHTCTPLELSEGKHMHYTCITDSIEGLDHITDLYLFKPPQQ